jgi:predicted RNase H-like HicB family nuclease
MSQSKQGVEGKFKFLTMDLAEHTNGRYRFFTLLDKIARRLSESMLQVIYSLELGLDARLIGLRKRIIQIMKLKVIVHEAEEGGYWAEVPAIPGCATQGDTFDELLSNLYEAVEGCLSVDVPL